MSKKNDKQFQIWTTREPDTRAIFANRLEFCCRPTAEVWNKARTLHPLCRGHAVVDTRDIAASRLEQATFQHTASIACEGAMGAFTSDADLGNETKLVAENYCPYCGATVVVHEVEPEKRPTKLRPSHPKSAKSQ